MKSVFTKKRLIFLSFWILPFCFLIIAMMYVKSAGIIHLLGVDPEYAYLFNGIILAHLHPDAYGVFHPGTPVQMLIAVVSWVVHLFRPGMPLWEDVMLNPEIYIKATIITGNAINTICLFLLGHFVFRYSKDIIVALALQATPFAFLMTLEVSRRMMPELIMVSIVSCWLIVLIKILYEPPQERNFKRYSLVFGVLYGLSFATKMTFLPYFLLPFIILPDWKLRMRFIAVSILSFSIFAFPVWFDFSRYWHWVSGNFIHTGNYGTGDRGIVNWNTFWESMRTIITSSWQLIIPIVILLVLVMVHHIRKNSDGIVRMGWGLLALLFLQLLITAKQYAFYYLTPSLLLCVFTGFMGVQLFNRLDKGTAFRKIGHGALVIFIAVLFISVLPKMIRQIKELHYLKAIRIEASNSLQPFLSETPKIICPNYYRSSAPEYGLFFGICESGHYSEAAGKLFRKKFPETIIYLPWVNTFFDANHAVKPSEFLKPDVDYTLYMGDFSEEQLDGIRTALNSDTVKYILDFKPLLLRDETKEAVYSVRATPVDGVTGSTQRIYKP
jgi:hypothetical protein